MIAIPDLINAASESTARYLNMLTEAGKGGTNHAATNVRPSPKRTTLIGNEIWPVILCDLPKHERFPPDSGAVFVPANHPGIQIGAQILDYDRRSGRAEIAVEALPPDEDGLLVIDFKWLIKRCLDWLMKNGRNVSNPFLLPAGSDFQIRHASGVVALSDEQSEAITSLLSHPAGYVWGPPGTGKTRHVLAETVAHLIRDGKRVLVTAPTNIAVDNALDAVLGLACVPDLDEAGYAPLAKVLPLLIQGCPISLLGDHRQLPPVYEGSKDVLSEAYWGVSALYLEEVFQSGIGDDPEQMVIHAKEDPRFQQLHRSQLTASYRFGPELADLLDRHFYKIGLKSEATSGTNIRSKDCPQTGPPGSAARQKRENPAEANRIREAVKNWVEWRPDSEKGGLAILTPYRNQVRLIRDALKALGNSVVVVGWRDQEWEDFRRVEVMTVHRSQGREWDTVFFSASDTGRLEGNSPFLADTSCLEGSLVVNTAISRSKKYLRFFLDRQFWAGRAVPNLLTEVAR